MKLSQVFNNNLTRKCLKDAMILKTKKTNKNINHYFSETAIS